jgi:hypothetical protein
MKPMKKLIASLTVMASLAVVAPQAMAGAVYHHWSETPAEVQATHSPEVLQSYIDAYWVNEWTNAYWFNRWMEAAATKAKQTGGSYVQGIEVCNGVDLPPCSVVHRESRFDPNAQNRSSSAWGLFQFLRSTWRSVCPEFPHGSATVAQQVECARRLWDGGRGRSHWSLTL